MTPKEKSIELINKFNELLPCEGNTTGQTPIDCAIICVDELINVLFNLPRIPFNIDQTHYFRKVKEELKNL